MFRNSPIFASFSVNDAKAAKEFYTETLGLDVSEVPKMDGNILQIHSPIQGSDGGGAIMVYAKGKDHQPATFTVLNIPVKDIKQAMTTLKSKGVTFEIYNTPDLKTDETGLMEDGGMSIAWFKDPAGNVMSILKEG